MIRQVKVEASRTDRTQSDVVAAALAGYLYRLPLKGRRKAASA